MAVREQIILEGVDKTSAAFRGVRNNLKGVENDAGRLGTSFSKLQRTIVGVATALGTVGLLKSVVSVSAEFEDLETALGSVTGSAENGTKAFKQIAKFSTQTQFGIEDLSTAFIKLKASGIEPTEELLTLFTDTAAVTTDQIGSLQAITDLFSRTTAGGLGLEELNRLADRGIPVFDILSEKIGVSRLEISKVGQTAEGAKRILDALGEGLEERFGGATEARLNNLSTALSNLGIAGRIAQGQIGEGGFADAIKEVTVSITEALTANEELFKSIGAGLGQAVRGTAIAVGFLIDNFAILKALGMAAIAFKATKAFLGLAAAFRAAGIASVAMGKKLKKNFVAVALAGVVAIAELTGALDKLFEAFESPPDPVDTLLQGLDRVTNALGKLQNSGVAAFQTLQDEGVNFVRGLEYEMEQLNKEIELQEELLREMDFGSEEYLKQQQNIEDLKTRYAELNDAVDNYLQAVMDVPFQEIFVEHIKILGMQKSLFDELANTSIQNYINSLQNLSDIQIFDQILTDIEKAELAFDKQVALFEEAAKRRVITEEQANTRIEKARRDLEDKLIKIEEAGLSEVARLEKELLDDSTKTIELTYDKRKRMLDRALADELITKERFAELEIALERKKSKEILENNKALRQELRIQELMSAGKTREQAESVAEFEKKTAVEKGAFVIGEGRKTFEALGQFNEQAFKAYKAFAIAEAIVSTYQGAAKALGAFPPPFNFVAAAAVVAQGFAQVSAIRSQQYSGRAMGGPVGAGQTYIVGERGAETFRAPPGGGMILPHGQGGGAVNVNFTVNAIDAQSFNSAISKQKQTIVNIVNEAVNNTGRRAITAY